MCDLISYGLKGIETYRKRAYSLGKKDEDGEKILSNIQLDGKKDSLQLIMEMGKLNLRYTQLLNMDGETQEQIAQITNAIIKDLKEEKIKSFYIIGGNEKQGDEYLHSLVTTVTEDIIILTFGDILNKYDNISKLIRLGDLSGVYAIVKILLALTDSFHCNINELPMRMFIYWREPEALCSAMTLLSIGAKNIYVEPKLKGILET